MPESTRSPARRHTVKERAKKSPPKAPTADFIAQARAESALELRKRWLAVLDDPTTAEMIFQMEDWFGSVSLTTAVRIMIGLWSQYDPEGQVEAILSELCINLENAVIYDIPDGFAPFDIERGAK